VFWSDRRIRSAALTRNIGSHEYGLPQGRSIRYVRPNAVLKDKLVKLTILIDPLKQSENRYPFS
jgi:hypothetical protein